jgi:hypothetical protein
MAERLEGIIGLSVVFGVTQTELRSLARSEQVRGLPAGFHDRELQDKRRGLSAILGKTIDRARSKNGNKRPHG